MSNHDELRKVCAWNRELVRENSRLAEHVAQLEVERDALGVQLATTDAFLGAAIDDALEARQR